MDMPNNHVRLREEYYSGWDMIQTKSIRFVFTYPTMMTLFLMSSLMKITTVVIHI